MHPPARRSPRPASRTVSPAHSRPAAPTGSAAAAFAPSGSFVSLPRPAAGGACRACERSRIMPSRRWPEHTEWGGGARAGFSGWDWVGVDDRWCGRQHATIAKNRWPCKETSAGVLFSEPSRRTAKARDTGKTRASRERLTSTQHWRDRALPPGVS